jgi:hypothetical protein
MGNMPGPPALRWSADHKCLVVSPGVDADDYRLADPVASPGEPTILAVQAGTGRLVTRPAPPGSDVAGPASATDNAVARFNGTTGKLIKNSTNAFVSDAGVLSLTAVAGGAALPNPLGPSTDGVLRNSQFLNMGGIPWTGPWAGTAFGTLRIERVGNHVYINLTSLGQFNNGPAPALITSTVPLPAWAIPPTPRNGTIGVFIPPFTRVLGSWTARADGIIEISAGLNPTTPFNNDSSGVSGPVHPSADFEYYVG